MVWSQYTNSARKFKQFGVVWVRIHTDNTIICVARIGGLIPQPAMELSCKASIEHVNRRARQISHPSYLRPFTSAPILTSWPQPQHNYAIPWSWPIFRPSESSLRQSGRGTRLQRDYHLNAEKFSWSLNLKIRGTAAQQNSSTPLRLSTTHPSIIHIYSFQPHI